MLILISTPLSFYPISLLPTYYLSLSVLKSPLSPLHPALSLLKSLLSPLHPALSLLKSLLSPLHPALSEIEET